MTPPPSLQSRVSFPLIATLFFVAAQSELSGQQTNPIGTTYTDSILNPSAMSEGLPYASASADEWCRCNDSTPCSSCALSQSCGGGSSSLCGCNCCGPVWLRAEVLLWWLSGDDLPPMATTSPLGTTGTDLGRLGAPGTSVLYSADDFSDAVRVGGRVTGGLWLDDCRRHGIQFDFFSVGSLDSNFSSASDGSEVLARPFFNTGTGQQDAQIIASPGLASGSIAVSGDDRIFSLAPSMRRNLACCTDPCGQSATRVDLIAGYRYLNFEESISFVETLSPTSEFNVPGTTYILRDTITTRNDFHGGELGLAYYRQHGNWVVELAPRVALGNMRRRIDASGSTQVLVPGALDRTIDGGFYVPSGRLRITDNEFAIIPQARVGIGYYLSQCLQIHVGYDFLYINNLFRPSSILGAGVDPNNLISEQLPATSLNPTDNNAWLQGISLGFTMNF